MNKFFLLIVIAYLGSCYPISPANAHSGSHPIRYVSAEGVDEGVCNQVSAPCKSITYAVNQSSKGDKIHVAQGEYNLQGLDIFFLLSDMVEVKGGYSKDFKSKTAAKLSSAISGIPVEYREKLQQRGFRLIQDSKESDIQLSIQDRQLLSQYQTITRSAEGPAECINGMAATYPCHNIDLQSHLPLSQFSSNPTSANDIWGFVDLNNQREYAIIGLRNATAVVDISNPQEPEEVGSIGGNSSSWRDIKVYQYFDQSADRYKAYAYVTTEAFQGLQIIDLSNLPTSIALANTTTEFNSAHNVYLANVDYATGVALSGMQPYLYVAGANKDGGIYRIFNLDDPLNPQLAAAPAALAGYVHDATSMVISDARTSQCAAAHNPCEILIDFNETSVDIWDVTDKTTPLKLSTAGYPNLGYTHSGWWSQDQQTIFIQDEKDERDGGLKTTLRALNISDLTNPVIVGTYTGQTNAIDHNGFTLGDYYYMSNYRRGLSVINVADPSNMQDIGFFDTFAIPAEDSATFNGAWGTYPFLPSGNILVSDIEYGLFVVKMNENDGAMPPNPTASSSTAPTSVPATSRGSSGSFGFGLLLLLALLGQLKLQISGKLRR